MGLDLTKFIQTILNFFITARIELVFNSKS